MQCLVTLSSMLKNKSDIKDFFYRLGIPAELLDFFALEPLKVGDLLPHLSLQEVQDWQHVLRGTYVSPCFQVSPMGFSWSFYLAQEAHRFVTKSALPSTILVQDNRPRSPLGFPGRHGSHLCGQRHAYRG